MGLLGEDLRKTGPLFLINQRLQPDRPQPLAPAWHGRGCETLREEPHLQRVPGGAFGIPHWAGHCGEVGGPS